MPASNPADRRLIAGLAGNTGWANTLDRSARTAPGRAKFADSFEVKAREIAPDASEAEIKVRAAHLRKAHMQRMALKSVQSRRAKAARRNA